MGCTVAHRAADGREGGIARKQNFELGQGGRREENERWSISEKRGPRGWVKGGEERRKEKRREEKRRKEKEERERVMKES